MKNKETLEFVETLCKDIGGTYKDENGLEQLTVSVEKLGVLWKNNKSYSGYYKGNKVIVFINNDELVMYSNPYIRGKSPINRFRKWFSNNGNMYLRDFNIILVKNPNNFENSPYYNIYKVV